MVAVSKGELDTNKIPRLYKEMKGNNDFLDFLIQSSLEDKEESEDQNTSTLKNQRGNNG